MNGDFIKRRNNYKHLLCYKKAEILYDITYYFVSKYIDNSDRTQDQMLQAVRSCKQNIVEGYSLSSTSTLSAIRLMNVAKSSLLELLADYEDYLRVRSFRQWEIDSKEFICMQNIGRTKNDNEYYKNLISTRASDVIANIAIILIKQEDYLLFKFIKSLCQRYATEKNLSNQLKHTLNNP